jgi:hypothetical protein
LYHATFFNDCLYREFCLKFFLPYPITLQAIYKSDGRYFAINKDVQKLIDLKNAFADSSNLLLRGLFLNEKFEITEYIKSYFIKTL